MLEHELAAGESLAGRFTLERRLGDSPSAETWLARDATDGGVCVVKVLGGARLRDVDQLRAFEREASVLGGLDHPGIPRLRAFFPVPRPDGAGAFALAIDHIEGVDLARHLSAGPRLGEDDVVALAAGLLDILTFLHTRSPPVFHRDIKPSNVIRRPDGAPALVDFGAVCDGWRGQHTIAVGTLGYMAPEQLHGRVTARSDLFSLGATLLHVATGRAPAECVDPERGALVLPPEADLPGGLAALIRACVAPAPGDRPRTARAARALLDGAAPASVPVGAPGPAADAEVSEGPAPPSPRRPVTALDDDDAASGDGGRVSNYAVVPEAPRDPFSPACHAQFYRYFDARRDKLPAVLTHLVMSLVAVLLAAGLSDGVSGTGPALLAVLALWGAVVFGFARYRTAKIMGRREAAEARDFARLPSADCTLLRVDPPDGYHVKVRLAVPGRDAPFDQHVRVADAQGWRAGQVVHALIDEGGPDHKAGAFPIVTPTPPFEGLFARARRFFLGSEVTAPTPIDDRAPATLDDPDVTPLPSPRRRGRQPLRPPSPKRAASGSTARAEDLDELGDDAQLALGELFEDDGAEARVRR